MTTGVQTDVLEARVSKKAYAAPDLIEHGDIHTLVQRNFVFGADGGTPVDNES